MLKGVNRQVVEIAQPDSIYFERVLFFVKPEYSSVSEACLHKKADDVIKNASDPPECRRRITGGNKVSQFVKMAGAAGIGAAAVGLISFFF